MYLTKISFSQQSSLSQKTSILKLTFHSGGLHLLHAVNPDDFASLRLIGILLLLKYEHPST